MLGFGKLIREAFGIAALAVVGGTVANFTQPGNPNRKNNPAYTAG